jgi:diacylglycerol kinase
MTWKKLTRSFHCAFRGLAYLIQNERSFKIHIIALAIVIFLSIYWRLSFIELAIILLVSALVLASEAINSGIEILLDIIYPEHNGKSKIIKDMMAGAVLTASLIAIVIGLLIFWPHLTS